MPVILLETFIRASPQVVFNISRSVDVHKASMRHHKEEVIDGTQTGLMNQDDTVTWKARHLWKSRTLKVKITALQSPQLFVDEMIEGDFKIMQHEHAFKPVENGTLMIDRFYFEAPFGILGRLANFLFLKTYMTRLLQERNSMIKQVAESNRAKQYLHT